MINAQAQSSNKIESVRRSLLKTTKVYSAASINLSRGRSNSINKKSISPSRSRSPSKHQLKGKMAGAVTV